MPDAGGFDLRADFNFGIGFVSTICGDLDDDADDEDTVGGSIMAIGMRRRFAGGGEAGLIGADFFN